MAVNKADVAPKVTKAPEKPKDPPKPSAEKVAKETKNKAETARTESKTAQDKAQKSEKKATEAGKQRTETKEKVDKADTERAKALSPGAKDTAQGKYDKADKDFKKADKVAKEANETAAKDRKDAVTAANKALTAEKEANDAAEKAGLDKPYALADKQKDVFDAGSLSAKDQTKLFGTKSVVKPKEAAATDAKSVAEATAKSPRAGSEELQQQLKEGKDPSYRKALVKESAPQVGKMADAVGDKKTAAEDRNAIVKNLADSSSMAGLEGRKTIADKLNGQKDQASVVEGLKANSKDAKSVSLGAEMARQERANFNYEKADAITRASPELKKAAAETPLDTALRKEVDLKTVGEEKAALQNEVKTTEDKLKARTEALSELAKDPSKLPEGVSVEKNELMGTTLVTKNKEGDVTERTSFVDNKDWTSISTQNFDRENSRVETESLGINYDNEAKTRTLESSSSSWKDKDVDAASKISSNRELEKRRDSDPNATAQSRTVGPNVYNGKLEEKTRTQDAKNGVTETTKTYSTQKNEEGLNDQLQGKFDDNRPIDKVDTKTVHIPPEGAKTPDGKEAKASFTSGTSYSQDNVRATSDQSKLVDRPEKKNGESAYSSGNPSDTGDVEERAKDADGSPKSWTLQTSKPGELNTQTFVEGQKDLSVTTRTKLQGNTVTETTSGKVPNPKDKDGDPVSISGTATRTYDKQGELAAARSDQTDANRTRTIEDYKRTEKRNDKGQLEVRERSTSATTPKDGPATNTQSDLTQTYNGKNQVVAAHLDQTDEKGTRTVQDYKRTDKRNDKGELELHEDTTSTRQPKDGAKTTLEQDQVSVATKQGPELVRASNKITTPDGTAQHTLTPDGQKLTVDGKKVDTLDGLKGMPKEKAALGAAAVDGVSKQVQDFNDTALALKPSIPVDIQRHNLKEVSATASANTAGLNRLKEALTPGVNGPGISLDRNARLAGGAGGIASLAGGAEILAKAGPLFMRDISQGNALKATKDGAALATGAIGVVGGANAAVTAFRGAGNGLSMDTKLLKLATLSKSPAQVAQKMGGVAKFSAGLGALSGGIQTYEGIQNGNGWQVASGVTTASAAVGGYLAAGAAAGAWGGPAGAAVGLAIGLGAWGMNKMFDHFDRSEYDIARVTI